ncbi:sugar phosphate nucleotidyltransferase [Aeromonas veronii]|uniref:sugar phosphate nucleotidyltransferase n=1 Tax=Aeromonas veronii TaxID=654 RepID=UPI000D8685FE
MLDTVKNIIPEGVNCFYVRQTEALGLGHAVLCAKQIVGNEPFAVLLADDMIYCDKTPCLDTMIALSNESHSSVVAVEAVPMEKVSQYGVIELITIGERLYKLKVDR